MNKVILIGNLARTPELRVTSTGVSVCNFTIAVNRRIPNAQGVREADFIPVVAWRQLAELCAKYLDKGRKCAVIGQIQNRSYETADGQKRFVTEIFADEVEFLDRAGQTQQEPGNSYAPNNYQPQSEPQPTFGGEGFTTVDDDELPF